METDTRIGTVFPPLTSPVAFVIFNRPDLTEKVFEAIAAVRPSKLLVIADGPRSDEEAEKCRMARAIIERVDWECEVLKNYADTNLGCRKRLSSGLDWVFSLVEEAIVLEDDCLPDSSFFFFCQELLERYRFDERVAVISGVNFQPPENNVSDSYFFSKYFHCWGWASWRRIWSRYDVEMATWPEVKAAGLLNNVLEHPFEQEYWSDRYDAIYKAQIDTWDYQYQYACWLAGGLTIIPSRNLVSNLGHRSDATHTIHPSTLADLPLDSLWELYHPAYVIRHRAADIYTFDYVRNGRANYEVQAARQKQSVSGADSIIKLTINGFNRLVRARHGCMLYNRNDVYIGRSVEQYGEWGEAEIELMAQFCRPGDIVVEVGANIGTHTLAFANCVGPEGRVYAFEPQRLVFQTLCANLALNSLTQVECFQVGICDQLGTLTVPPIAHHLHNNFGGISLQKGGEGETVPSVTLDTVLNLQHLRLIKIDVEGMESKVIAGAARLLRTHRPFLYLENDRVDQSEELIRQLLDLNYQLYWHVLPAYSADNYAENPENIFPEGFSINMLGIPAELQMQTSNLDEIKDPTEHPLRILQGL